MEESQRERKFTRRKNLACRKNDDDTTQSNENTLDSNIYLTYDILRIIFQYFCPLRGKEVSPLNSMIQN